MEWEQAAREALAWALVRNQRIGILDHFALNVVQLIKGQFAEAWSSRALAQEPDDIAQVKSWLDGLVARHADQPNAHLVMGLFLSQSGQSEQSMQSYRQQSWHRNRPIHIIFLRRFMNVQTTSRWRSKNIGRR